MSSLCNYRWPITIGVLLFTLWPYQLAANAQWSPYRRHSAHHRYAGYAARSHYQRRAAAAARAQKAQMIRLLQAQVAEAERVLQKATSSSAQSELKASEAMHKLDSTESQMSSLHHDVYQATVDLQNREAEIMANEKDDSELAKAEEAVDQLEEQLEHLIMTHSSVDAVDWKASSWQTALSKLEHPQREVILKDSEYVDVHQQLIKAEEDVQQVRQALFKNDSQWVKLKKQQQQMVEDARKESAHVKPAKQTLTREKRELNSVEEVASYAQNIVTQGKQRLRQLGVKETHKPAK